MGGVSGDPEEDAPMTNRYLLDGDLFQRSPECFATIFFSFHLDHFLLTALEERPMALLGIGLWAVLLPVKRLS